MSATETVHQRIKRLRIEHGWTQKELGEMCGVIYQAVQAWESRAIPSEPALVSKVLGVSVQYLLTGSNLEEEPESVRAATLRPIVATLQEAIDRLAALVAQESERASNGDTALPSTTAARGLKDRNRAQLRIRKKQGRSSP